MADCEICGAEDAGYVVEIEGARLRVCPECAKGGKVLEAPRPPPMPKRQAQGAGAGYGGYGAWGEGAREPRQKTEIEIVADFGMKIRAARERMHIERKVLAEMINEKESMLERLEHEKMLPSEAVAVKLERALGVKLREEVGVGSGGASARKAEGKGLTLGDVVFMKKKKDDEG